MLLILWNLETSKRKPYQVYCIGDKFTCPLRLLLCKIFNEVLENGYNCFTVNSCL
jgi:hypothetical protein